MEKLLIGILFLIQMALFVNCGNSESIKGDSILSKTPFGVCYAKVSPLQVKNYKMVVIEPDFYSKAEIEALKASGTTIIAYITLGEVDKNRWYYPLLERRGFVGINENWNSPYLNLSDEETKEIMLDKVLPEIMVKGVDGVFLDTIDAVAPYTERKNMEPDMVEVIKGIRERYPDTIIIQNAGLFLLNDSKSVIDAVLIEDIASGYDFEKKEYFVKNYTDFKERLELIKDASKKHEVPFFVVDFAESSSSIHEIKTRLDSVSVPYFISNIQLTQLPLKPGKVANRIKVD